MESNASTKNWLLRILKLSQIVVSIKNENLLLVMCFKHSHNNEDRKTRRQKINGNLRIAKAAMAGPFGVGLRYCGYRRAL